MQKAFFYLIIITLLIVAEACNNKNPKESDIDPQNLIPKEKMIDVLADVQIIEAYIDDLRKSGHQTKDSSMLYFEKVFNKHEINAVMFEESLLFYKSDLAEINEMYAQVITRLSELKAKNEELIIQMEQDSIKQDSIEKAQAIADSIEKAWNETDSTHLKNDSIFVLDSISNADTNNIILN